VLLGRLQFPLDGLKGPLGGPSFLPGAKLSPVCLGSPGFAMAMAGITASRAARKREAGICKPPYQSACLQQSHAKTPDLHNK